MGDADLVGPRGAELGRRCPGFCAVLPLFKVSRGDLAPDGVLRRLDAAESGRTTGERDLRLPVWSGETELSCRESSEIEVPWIGISAGPRGGMAAAENSSALP